MKKLVYVMILVLAVLLCSCTDEVEEYKKAYENMYDHMSTMWASSLEGFKCPIAFYGDSRVAGADWNKLYEDLDPQRDMIVNLGIGGDTIERTLQRLPLLDALEIEYCFLSIGGNNALSDSYDRTKFRQNYDRLLTELHNRGIKVYAHTIVGITTANSSASAKFVKKKNDKIADANGIMKEVISAHVAKGEDIILIDIAAMMNESDGSMKAAYSAEGVHFTQAGNEYWAGVLKPYVQEIIQNYYQ